MRGYPSDPSGLRPLCTVGRVTAYGLIAPADPCGRSNASSALPDSLPASRPPKRPRHGQRAAFCAGGISAQSRTALLFGAPVPRAPIITRLGVQIAADAYRSRPDTRALLAAAAAKWTPSLRTHPQQRAATGCRPVAPQFTGNPKLAQNPFPLVIRIWSLGFAFSSDRRAATRPPQICIRIPMLNPQCRIMSNMAPCIRHRYSYWHIIDIVGRTPDAEKGRAFRYSSKAAKRTTGKARSAEATQIAAGTPGNDLHFSTNVQVGTDLGINAQDCATRPSRTGPLIFTQHS